MTELIHPDIELPEGWQNGGRWADADWGGLFADTPYNELFQYYFHLATILETESYYPEALEGYRENQRQSDGYLLSERDAFIEFMMVSASKFNWINERFTACDLVKLGVLHAAVWSN